MEPATATVTMPTKPSSECEISVASGRPVVEQQELPAQAAVAGNPGQDSGHNIGDAWATGTQEVSSEVLSEQSGGESGITIASVVSMAEVVGLAGRHPQELWENNTVDVASHTQPEHTQLTEPSSSSSEADDKDCTEGAKLGLSKVDHNVNEKITDSGDISGEIEMTIIDVRSLSDESNDHLKEESVDSHDSEKPVVGEKADITESQSSQSNCSESNTSKTNSGKSGSHERIGTENIVSSQNDSVTATMKSVLVENDSEEILLITDVRSLSEERVGDQEQAKLASTSDHSQEKIESNKVDSQVNQVPEEVTQVRTEHKSGVVQKRSVSDCPEEIAGSVDRLPDSIVTDNTNYASTVVSSSCVSSATSLSVSMSFSALSSSSITASAGTPSPVAVSSSTVLTSVSVPSPAAVSRATTPTSVGAPSLAALSGLTTPTSVGAPCAPTDVGVAEPAVNQHSSSASTPTNVASVNSNSSTQDSSKPTEIDSSNVQPASTAVGTDLGTSQAALKATHTETSKSYTVSLLANIDTSTAEAAATALDTDKSQTSTGTTSNIPPTTSEIPVPASENPAIAITSKIPSIASKIPATVSEIPVTTSGDPAPASDDPSTNGLPVISSIFSIKQEPAEDGSYGVIPGAATSVRQPGAVTGSVSIGNRASISTVVNKLHGKKVNPSPQDAASAKPLKMIPVSSSNPLPKVGQYQIVYPSLPNGKHQTSLANPNHFEAGRTGVSSSVSRQVVVDTPAGPRKMVITNDGLRILPAASAVVGKGLGPMRPLHGCRPVQVKLPAPKSVVEQQKPIKQIIPQGPRIMTLAGAGTTSSPMAVLSIPNQAAQKLTITTPSTAGKQSAAIIQTTGKKDAIIVDTKNFINIQTVGVDKVTELIARKNPIPMYKPPPMPDNVKESKGKIELYPCYECGDTFHFEKSLLVHESRVSMRLQYRCTTCAAYLAFTNKCQLLSHLRSHLHIDKTQAVPIHIKSDSIHIKTVYDEIGAGKDFEWYNEKKVEFGKNYDSCVVCDVSYRDGTHRTGHFRLRDGNTPVFCSTCSMAMTNKCSLKLHENLHTVIEDGRVKHDMICPECGLNFGQTDIDKFCHHMYTSCFHAGHMWVWQCNKCAINLISDNEVKQHLLAKLENYYKCMSCPMALKSLASFISHYREKHGQMLDPIKHVKMIYRCHVCDTLIDEKGFLMSHIQKHVAAYKTKGRFAFYCRQCGQFFNTRALIKSHFENKHSNFNCKARGCYRCNVKYDNALEMFLHTVQVHKLKVYPEESTFCKCGLLCTSGKMLSEHACLLDVGIDGQQGEGIDSQLGKGIVSQLGKGIVSQLGKGIDSQLGKGIDSQSGKGKNSQLCKGTISALYQLPVNANIQPGQGEGGNVLGPVVVKQEPGSTGNTTAGKGASPKEFVCPVCLIPFASNAARINHIVHHRARGNYICVNCNKTDFRDYHDLRSHEIYCIEKSKKINTSPIAKDTKKKNKSDSKTSEDDEDTESDVETEKNFGKVRLNLKGVNQQNRYVDKGESYRCDKCSAVFTRQSKLAEHQAAEHSLHACHLCGLMYQSLSKLKIHLLISHKGQKPVFYCWVCRGRKIDKYYTERSSLERHLGQKHRLKNIDRSKIVAEFPGEEWKGVSPEPQMLITVQTGDTCDDAPPLKKLKVDGENVFKCAKCMFTCESKAEFREHIVEHRAAETVQCLECGLCFTVLPSLQRHVFMVHKIRDFNTYRKENAIEEPKELETLDLIEREPEAPPESSEPESEEEEEAGNPLECKVCYKSFDSEHSLKQHMRVHGMAFIRKSSRRGRVAETRKTDKHTKSETKHAENDAKLAEKDSQSDIKKTEQDVQSKTESVIENKESVNAEAIKAKKPRTESSASDIEEPISKKPRSESSAFDIEEPISKKARIESDDSHIEEPMVKKARNEFSASLKTQVLKTARKESDDFDNEEDMVKKARLILYGGSDPDELEVKKAGTESSDSDAQYKVTECNADSERKNDGLKMKISLSGSGDKNG